MPFLTLGMATYDDFHGVWFTLSSLRLHQDLSDCEIVVIDNYGCEDTRIFVEHWTNARYILARENTGTSAPRHRIFTEARGDVVLVMDCHVLLANDSIKRLKDWFRQAGPNYNYLIQGPLVYDDLNLCSTHFEPVWRSQMWGVWSNPVEWHTIKMMPSLEIPMQGLGLFSCRKSAWPGFHPKFRGFGGEEGYIHEKFRQRGGKVLCLPWLRWMHRFTRPGGVRYPLRMEDRIFNYFLGHLELGLNTDVVTQHFSQYQSIPKLEQILAEAKTVL